MTDTNRYRALLADKKELVFELLRLSNDVGLKEDSPDEAADRYVGFVASREELIAKLKALDAELDATPREDSGETAALLRDIRGMADQVIRLEPEIQRKAQVLSVHYQRRINAINTRRQETQSRGEYTKGLRYQQNV